MFQDYLAPQLRLRSGELTEATAELDLFVDGEMICSVKSLLNGILYWMAAFYVFNVEYPECYKNSLQFIQKFLLGMTDRIKIASIILKLVKQLA